MTSKALSILGIAVLALLASVPLAAQTEQPVPEQPAGESGIPAAEEQAPAYEPEPGSLADEAEDVADETVSEGVGDEAEDVADEAGDVFGDDEMAAEDDTLAADVDADDELPRTASPLALLALLGSAGLASGTAVRYLRRK